MPERGVFVLGGPYMISAESFGGEGVTVEELSVGGE